MSDPQPAAPLREGWSLEHLPEACVMVIFGASGDLTRRKLMPAIYSLFRQNLLRQGFSVVGVSNVPMNDDEFRRQMRAAVPKASG